MGGGVIIEPYHVPLNDDGDAHDGVGAINPEHVDGLGEPEGEVAEDAVAQLGRQAGPRRGNGGRQGGCEAGDECGGVLWQR